MVCFTRCVRKSGKVLPFVYGVPYSLSIMRNESQLPLRTIQILLEYNMPVNYKTFVQSHTLLQTAIVSRNIDLLKILILYNVDLNSSEGHAIRHAAWFDNLEITDILIAAGVDVNVCPYSYDPAIIIALKSSTAEIVSQLIAAGATIPESVMYYAKHTKYYRQEKIAIIEQLVLPSE